MHLFRFGFGKSCNPKLAKAKDPNYKCNSITGRWVKKERTPFYGSGPNNGNPKPQPKPHPKAKPKPKVAQKPKPKVATKHVNSTYDTTQAVRNYRCKTSVKLSELYCCSLYL